MILNLLGMCITILAQDKRDYLDDGTGNSDKYALIARADADTLPNVNNILEVDDIPSGYSQYIHPSRSVYI